MPDVAAGELVGDLDGPLAVVTSNGTVTRLPLVVDDSSSQPRSAVGPDGCVAAVSLLQPQAFVDPRDAAGPLDRGWRIEWAVGVQDRWHIAGREAAVRARLVDDMPVTETAMRVPGGDIVQRVWAVRDGSGRSVMLEFENQSPDPVTLALAVIENDAWRDDTSVRTSIARRVRGPRSHQRDGSAVVEVRGSKLMVDGQVALELGRAPGGAVAVVDGRVWAAVAAGPDSADCRSQSQSGRAAAAAVIPLVPGAPLRATVPLPDAPDHSPVGQRVLQRGAACSEAVSGWRAVVARATSVSLPDETATRAWRRGIAGSILTAGSGRVLNGSGCLSPPAARPGSQDETIVPAGRLARTAVLLDRVGLPDEADRAREPLLVAAEASLLCGEEANSALLALSSRRLRSGRASGLADLAGPLVFKAGDMLERHTLEQAAAALDVEAPAASGDARRMLRDFDAAPSGMSHGRADAPHAGLATKPLKQKPRGEPRRLAGDRAAGPSPQEAGGASTPRNLAEIVRRSIAFGGDGLRGVEALVDCLVTEAQDHLVIAPSMPDEWIGAPVDAHGLRTRHGVLSFSVRWHGTRPALLWDLHPAHADSPKQTSLRCGLDESWSSASPTGEALLKP